VSYFRFYFYCYVAQPAALDPPAGGLPGELFPRDC